MRRRTDIRSTGDRARTTVGAVGNAVRSYLAFIAGFLSANVTSLGADHERDTSARVGDGGGHGHSNPAGGVGWFQAFRLVLVAAAITSIFQTAVRAQSTEEADGATAEPRAWVIELLIEGRDTVPILTSERHRGGGHPLAWFEDGALVLDPATMSSYKSPELAALLRFDDGIQQLAEIAVVIIERRSFLGQYRRGQVTIIWARRELPPFPRGQRPEAVLITPFGAKPPLEDLVVWPEVEWRLEAAAEDSEELTEQDPPLLVVEMEDGRKELPPGEALTLETLDWSVPVTLGRFAPVPVGVAPETLEPIEVDLGDAVFSTEVTLRFHGRLPLRVGR